MAASNQWQRRESKRQTKRNSRPGAFAKYRFTGEPEEYQRRKAGGTIFRNLASKITK